MSNGVPPNPLAARQTVVHFGFCESPTLLRMVEAGFARSYWLYEGNRFFLVAINSIPKGTIFNKEVPGQTKRNDLAEARWVRELLMGWAAEVLRLESLASVLDRKLEDQSHLTGGLGCWNPQGSRPGDLNPKLTSAAMEFSQMVSCNKYISNKSCKSISTPERKQSHILPSAPWHCPGVVAILLSRWLLIDKSKSNPK